MRQTRGAVNRMRCYGSSKGRAVTANVVHSAATPRLPDNLSNFSQKLQRSKKLTFGLILVACDLLYSF
jgi:hypothetical protein